MRKRSSWDLQGSHPGNCHPLVRNKQLSCLTGRKWGKEVGCKASHGSFLHCKVLGGTEKLDNGNDVRSQKWCLPWGRLGCPVSSLPCRMLVLLVHPGNKFIAQEVVLLSLWSVESLWLAEHFLLLTGPLVPPLPNCPPFYSLVYSWRSAHPGVLAQPRKDQV